MTPFPPPLLLAAILAGCTTAAARDSSTKLWYRQPGTCFEESLLLGNGTQGAAVLGGTATERIFLNDATFWSGEPVDPNDYLQMHKHLPAVREALAMENYKLADQLIRKMQGRFTESYSVPGTLLIDFPHTAKIGKYIRSLDLKEAVSCVDYESGGIRYSREYFVSHPDRLLVIRLKASKKGSLDFTIRFESPTRNRVGVETKNRDLIMHGYAPYHVAPPFLKDDPDPIRFDPARGTRFTLIARIKSADGSIASTGNSVSLKGGSEALILVSLATSFNGFDKNPATEGLPDEKIAQENLTRAMKKSYKELRREHVTDYRNFFDRVHLDLGGGAESDQPTDERLRKYAQGADDHALEAMYFNLGRYLLISSSRTPGAPPNLQGIWNTSIRPPWACNYTLNINLEENYWPAEITNLSELTYPLFDFIGNLSKTGSLTARVFYGAGGWTAAHTSDIWAMSNPVGNFGKGNPAWANWPMGGAWLSTHLWEHYAFTGDREFLLQTAYPLMKGASAFCLDLLVEDREGNLITSPSTSPENKYLTPDGYAGAVLSGGTADLAIIRECFTNTLNAAKVLDIDAEFVSRLEKALARLHPYHIGSAGNLQEWYHDWKDFDPIHRHQSHLIGLFPGHQIRPDTTPELAKACGVTLDGRGDDTTGWSKGWRASLWARLWNGNRAYRNYRQLLSYIDPSIDPVNLNTANGTYPNLLNGPPYQIDGNLSGTAALAEMLLQSGDGEIWLLPALPDAWPEGVVRGLKARGNFTVDIAWKGGNVTAYRILSNKPQKIRLHMNGEVRTVTSDSTEKLSLR